MLDLTQEECKIVEQALDSHVEKLVVNKARSTSPGQKRLLDERINEVQAVRHKVINQSKD